MTPLYKKAGLTCAVVATAVLFYAMPISYLANGADDPNQLRINKYTPPRASQKINSSKFRILADYDQQDGTACNKSTQCDSTCCEDVSATVKICAPWLHKNTRNGDRYSDYGYPCLDP
jgi:hypothetical protein